MSWLFYALLAPAVYAIVTFIDKYLLSKEIKDYSIMPIYTGIVGFIAGTILWIVLGFPLLPLKDAAIVLLTGILTGASLLVYFKALDSEETSTINILFQMFPVISLLLALIFLHEKISFNQSIGFVLIMGAVLSISFEGTKGLLSFSPAFFLILLYDLAWATMGILTKYTSSTNSFWRILNYESWGIGIGALLIFIFFPKIRSSFLKSVKKIKPKTVIVVGLNEGVFVLAKTLTFFSFSIGPAALVSVLETTQALYAILYGVILTKLFPRVFDEDTSLPQLSKKVVAALVVLIGIVLINR